MHRAASDVDTSVVGNENPKPARSSTEHPVLEHPTPSSVEVGIDVPPPSNTLEEQPRAPFPDHLGAPSDRPVMPPNIADRGKGPMAPSTMVGRSTHDEEP